MFAVGHTALSTKGWWLAGVLALGPEAVLSHRSAAALLGLRPSSASIADVLIPHRDGHPRRAGLRVHRTTSLPRGETAVEDAIPVTSWARTLLDLAPVVDRSGLAKALERSEELQLFDFPTVARVLEAHNGHHGIGRLRRALLTYEPQARSELQRRFRELCIRHGFPRPEEEVALVDDHRVDFVWRVERLVVETDGWRFHRTRAAWARDREQEARLVIAGYTVLRPTWDDVIVNEAQTATRVALLLAAGRRVGRVVTAGLS